MQLQQTDLKLYALRTDDGKIATETFIDILGKGCVGGWYRTDEKPEPGVGPALIYGEETDYPGLNRVPVTLEIANVP